MPTLGWIPLLLLGIGEALKLAIIAKAAFVPMALTASAGVRGVLPHFVEVAEALCLTRWRRLRRLTLPAAWP